MSDKTQKHIDLLETWSNGNKKDVESAIREMSPSEAFTFGTYFAANFEEPQKTMEIISMYTLLSD